MTSLFSVLALKIIPLYANVALGFVAGKFLKVQRESIVNLTFYLVVPIVVFIGVSHANFTPKLLLLPVIIASIATTLALVVLKITKSMWEDKTPSLLSFTAGAANAGYFGLPIATILFPKETVAIYIVCIIGVILYEYTVGYYITARANFTPRQSLIKVVKLPSIYAFLLGLAVSASGTQLPEFVDEFGNNIRATYSVLGMMILGVGLSSIQKLEIDFKYLLVTHSAKFIGWPLLTYCVVALDVAALGIFGADVHKAMMLLSLMPLAANTVVFASLFDCNPEKAAFAVLISTILALFYIPAMAALFL